MPSRSTAAAQAFHRAQIVKAVRALLESGDVIETALDCVLEGARREFHCSIVFDAPAVLRIDTYPYRWPADG